MGWFYLLVSVIVSWVLFLPSTHEMQTSHTEVLMQLRKHLEFPSSLGVLENYTGDLCNLSSSDQLSISCQGNSITELKVWGDKLFNLTAFNGFSIPNKTLSERFSIDSFVTTLSRLPSLKVLSLVSLGIWGPLPDKIHRLSLLEVLDLSSNFMYGAIPSKISTMRKLHTLSLEGNYFNETVPDWFDSLSNLSILCLKNNRLKGQFPSSICRTKTLTGLALSHNELSGKLPDMNALTSLRVLDLRENGFGSGLPVMPKGLVTILLSKNSFSEKIPVQFGDLSQLQHLDLSFNYLSGAPPSNLFSLPEISYLNLASNMLSGAFPSDLNCGGKLGFVDISNNKLAGDLPSCLGSTSDEIVVELSGNCLANGSQHQHELSYCKAIARRKQSNVREIVVLVAIVIGALLVMVLLVLVVLSLCRRYRARKSEHNIFAKAVTDNSPIDFFSDLVTNARYISQAAKLETHGASACRLFSLEELKEATNDFDFSMFLGEGSMGKMPHSFPEIWNIEKRYGSVIAGAVRSKLSSRKEKSGETKASVEKGKRQRNSFSFQGGMQTLTDTLCKQLGSHDLKLNSKVLSLSYSHDGNTTSENWSVSCVANAEKHSQSSSVDAVILTAPLCSIKEMKITRRGTIFPLDFLPEVYMAFNFNM